MIGFSNPIYRCSVVIPKGLLAHLFLVILKLLSTSRSNGASGSTSAIAGSNADLGLLGFRSSLVRIFLVVSLKIPTHAVLLTTPQLGWNGKFSGSEARSEVERGQVFWTMWDRWKSKDGGHCRRSGRTMVWRNANFRAVFGTTQGIVGTENPPGERPGRGYKRWSSLLFSFRRSRETYLFCARGVWWRQARVVFLGRILCDIHPLSERIEKTKCSWWCLVHFLGPYWHHCQPCCHSLSHFEQVFWNVLEVFFHVGCCRDFHLFQSFCPLWGGKSRQESSSPFERSTQCCYCLQGRRKWKRMEDSKSKRNAHQMRGWDDMRNTLSHAVRCVNHDDTNLTNKQPNCAPTCQCSCALRWRCSGSWWSRCHWCRARCHHADVAPSTDFFRDLVNFCTCSQTVFCDRQFFSVANYCTLASRKRVIWGVVFYIIDETRTVLCCRQPFHAHQDRVTANCNWPVPPGAVCAIEVRRLPEDPCVNTNLPLHQKLVPFHPPAFAESSVPPRWPSAVLVHLCGCDQFAKLCFRHSSNFSRKEPSKTLIFQGRSTTNRSSEVSDVQCLEPCNTCASRGDWKQLRLCVQHKTKDMQHCLHQLRIIVRTRGKSLCLPCSWALRCFRSLHTVLGLSPCVPGHRLTGCQGPYIHSPSIVRHILGVSGVDKVRFLGHSNVQSWTPSMGSHRVSEFHPGHLSGRTRCVNWVPL